MVSSSFLLRKRNTRISDKFVEKIRKHILCSVTFFFVFSKITPFFLDNAEKYCRAGHATDDNMAHAYCPPDTKCYKHKLRICDSYCFCSATADARRGHNVTLYVHYN